MSRKTSRDLNGALLRGLFLGAHTSCLTPSVDVQSVPRFKHLDRLGRQVSQKALALTGSPCSATTPLAINFLDFGVQSGQIANQARIFELGQEFRARLNTLYMVVNFAGGALGGLAGGIVWNLAGWQGVCLLSMTLTSIAGAFLAPSIFRRR